MIAQGIRGDVQQLDRLGRQAEDRVPRGELRDDGILRRLADAERLVAFLALGIKRDFFGTLDDAVAAEVAESSARTSRMLNRGAC